MKSQKPNIKTPYLIGVTGSFGSGKSLIGDILKQTGIFVIDTDRIVGDILRTKNNITKKIARAFGAGIVENTLLGFINKKKLSKIVFSNKSKLKKLESIVHPGVQNRLRKIITKNKNRKVIAVLVPLLFECNLQKNYNETWCVICNKNTQLKRLTNKGFSHSEAISRINAQWSQLRKASLADYVIDNSGFIRETRKRVLKKIVGIINELRAES